MEQNGLNIFFLLCTPVFYCIFASSACLLGRELKWLEKRYIKESNWKGKGG